MAVFGEILVLYHVPGTTVFVAVMLFLSIFEGLLHYLEVECTKRGFKGLIKKLYREFMIMGFISFAILLGTESQTKTFSLHNEWYQSFLLAHIVIMFIGITFLFQSVLLVSLISVRNRTLLSYGDSSAEKLTVEYIHVHSEEGIQRFFFDHGPISFPFPQIREKIEYKMLQEFFINFYNLPREFKFANYMCQVLKNYVISLVEVRPVTWVILVILIALNDLRIAVIDPIYERDVCRQFKPDPHSYGVRRGGGGETSGTTKEYRENVCPEYTLRYIFVCSMMIVLYLIGLAIASEVYIQRLVDKVLDIEEYMEKEEDRVALENEPLFDAEELPGSGEVTPTRGSTDDLKSLHLEIPAEDNNLLSMNDGSNSPKFYGNSPMRPLSKASTISALTDKTQGKLSKLESFGFRRTASKESIHDVESGGLRQRQNSVGSQHRGSMAQTIFGDDLSHFQAIVMGKNRRHLYLNCLQRMIQSEEEFNKKEARRMSISSDDGGHRSSVTTTVSVTRKRAHTMAPKAVTEMYGQYFGTHEEDRHTTSKPRQASITNASFGHSHAEDHRSPIPEKMKSIRNFFNGRSRDAHESHGTAHTRGNVESTGSTPKPHRPRGYSATYFEIDHSLVEASKPKDDDWRSKAAYWYTGCRDVVHKTMRRALNAFLGHHIGKTEDDFHLDKDVQQRLQEFKSIFLFRNAEYYYFAVEIALLIQCFYIALWATNFVVIARDSHHPILWQIALVVPLPINFFLLKQIIFTSCILKSIVEIDQRTAQRIIDQAVDERNVIDRLRRRIRDALKEYEIAKKEWPTFLKEKFDAFAEPDGSLEKDSFTAFLHDIQIYIAEDSMKSLFKVIDVDKDKRISWSLLSKIVFPDHKKKNIKLRKRKTSQGRVAYDYSISTEAKQELEAERRSSVLGMLTSVSRSAAGENGVITAQRAGSFTRLSIANLFGSSLEKPPTPRPSVVLADSVVGEVNEHQHNEQKDYTEVAGRKTLAISALKSKPKSVRIQSPSETTYSRRTKNADQSHSNGDYDDNNEEDDEDDEDVDSNDSTSGDEEDNASVSERSDVSGNFYDDYDQNQGNETMVVSGQVPFETLSSLQSNRQEDVATASTIAAASLPSEDVITLNSRHSNARISARNLFDV